MKKRQTPRLRYFFFSFSHIGGFGNGTYSGAVFPSLTDIDKFLAMERPGIVVLSIQELSYKDYQSLLSQA